MNNGVRSFFDGVQNPIMRQGDVTLNLKPDRQQIARRKHNANQTNKKNVIPGGGVDANHVVMPHEMVFGLKRARKPLRVAGHSNQTALSSLNGVDTEGKRSEVLTTEWYFVGIAKTPGDETDIHLKTGFTAFRVGSGTTVNTGREDLYAGDVLCYRFPELPNEIGRKNNPTNPRIGTPGGKVRWALERLKPGDEKIGVWTAIHALKNSPDPVGAKTITLLDFPHRAPARKLTDAEQHGVALKYAVAMIGARFIDILKTVPGIGNPRLGELNSRDITDTLGLFDNKLTPAQVALHETLVNAMFAPKDAEIPPNPDETTLKTNAYDRVVRDISGLLESAYLQASAHQRERTIGTAQSFAKPGHRVDVLIGHTH